MTERDFQTSRSGTPARAVGYEALVQLIGLNVTPNWHRSFVSGGNTHRIETVSGGIEAGIVEEVYPVKYWPGDGLGDHLEFALKYDGTNLALLARIFRSVPQDAIIEYVASKPRGKYARRIWFLYEMLTGVKLPLDDLATGGYVDLLNPEEYYTAPSRPVRRQRINDNLLGNRQFCPTVRRTDKLRKFEQADFSDRCRRIVAGFSPSLLKRAMSYLYTKETKSSFEIEHLKPDSSRTERFIALLQSAESENFCDKSRLLDLQNRIADPRFRDTDYRTTQNYVGERISWQTEKVHYVAPKPTDLPDLMEGLIAAHRRMDAETAAVVHAAVVSYSFVFLHPFEDGNGRIHRFLIHNILARKGFTPKGLIFPVSASMLKNPTDYDASLEAFSRPLMERIDFTLDDEGRMEVHNETALWYRYADLTAQAEALFGFIEQTVETELAEELTFLVSYDRTRSAIQEIVDMADGKIDIFIRLCLQNGGRLSAAKRGRLFSFLTDDEIASMEKAVQSGYDKNVPAD